MHCLFIFYFSVSKFIVLIYTAFNPSDDLVVPFVDSLGCFDSDMVKAYHNENK